MRLIVDTSRKHEHLSMSLQPRVSDPLKESLPLRNNWEIIEDISNPTVPRENLLLPCDLTIEHECFEEIYLGEDGH